jgi:hypothetical protein
MFWEYFSFENRLQTLFLIKRVCKWLKFKKNIWWNFVIKLCFMLCKCSEIFYSNKWARRVFFCSNLFHFIIIWIRYHSFVCVYFVKLWKIGNMTWKKLYSCVNYYLFNTKCDSHSTGLIIELLLLIKKKNTFFFLSSRLAFTSWIITLSYACVCWIVFFWFDDGVMEISNRGTSCCSAWSIHCRLPKRNACDR